MPEYSTELAALEALLEDRCLPGILRRLDIDELIQLGQAAQDLAQHCENAWLVRLAEGSERCARLLGQQGDW